MKKLCFLLALLLAFTCTGCKKESGSQNNDPVAAYASKAQEYLDAGDTETAIAVLEEGIATTGSDELTAMLEQLQSGAPSACASCGAELAENAKFCGECGEEVKTAAPLTNCPDCGAELTENAKFCGECGADLSGAQAPSSAPATSDAFDLQSYTGAWCTEYSCYAYGGLIIDVAEQGNNASFDISLVSASPNCYISEVSKTFSLSELQNPLSFSFEDSWGNSGTMTMNFGNGNIELQVSNVQANSDARWGFTENTSYSLHYSPDIHNLMSEPKIEGQHSLSEAKNIIQESVERQMFNTSAQVSADGRYYLTYINDTPFSFDLYVTYYYYIGDTQVDSEEISYIMEPETYADFYQNPPQNCESWNMSYQYGNIYENGFAIY